MQYSGDTVAVTYNQSIVWKNGATSSWAGVKAGSLFGVQGDGVFYPVAQYRPGSGGTADSIVLTGTYRGGTNASAQYVITNDFTPNLGLPLINRGDLETATIFDYAMAAIDTSWKSVPGDMFKSVYDPSSRGYVDHAVLADQVAWAGVTGKPTLFPPATHAPTHLVGGADPIALTTPTTAGLCPPIDNATIVITGGKLTAMGQLPLAHAATHHLNGSDPIGLATPTSDGLCPPIDNTTIQISGGKLIAANHAARHLANGADPIALASTTSDGMCPPVDGTTVQVLGGKLVCTVQVGAHLTYYQAFNVPAAGATVPVTFSDISDVVPGAGYLLTDGTNFMNGVPIAPVTGLTVTMQNVGGGLVSGTLGAGRVYAGNTIAGTIGGGGAADPLLVGTVFAFASTTPPTGCLLCNGGPVSRATFPDLFALLGTTYGAGDGSTTFGIPDLRSRMIVGSGQGTGLTNRLLGASGGEETHVLVLAELAAHAHGMANHTHTMGGHTHLGVDHLHSMQGHVHGVDHYHAWSAQGSHAHGLGGHYHGVTAGYPNSINYGTTNPGYQFYQAAQTALNTGGPSGGSDAANTPAGNTVYASQTNGAWVNSGGPSAGTTGAMDRGATTGGPSTNTSDGPSTNTSGSSGSDTAHNTMAPFQVLAYMIKAAKSGPTPLSAPPADTTQPGLLNKVSGLATDYVGGDNATHDLGGAMRTLAPIARSYNSLNNPTFEYDSRTVGVGTTAAGFAMDRWQFMKVGTYAGSWKQIDASPTGGVVIAGTNFCISSKFLRFTVTTAAALAAGDYNLLMQKIEGVRFRELLGGQTAITLVVRASIATTVSLCLRDATNAYSLVKQVPISSPNSWLAVPLPNVASWAPSGTFNLAQGQIGYTLGIVLGAGSTFTPGANDVWVAGNYIGAVGAVNFMANNGATFDLGYIMHEPGPTPGGIIDKSWQDNEWESQRYWAKSYPYNQVAGTSNLSGTPGLWTSSSWAMGWIGFPRRMALVPAVTYYNPSTGAANSCYSWPAGTALPVGTQSPWGITEMGINGFSPTGVTANQFCYVHWTADTSW